LELYVPKERKKNENACTLFLIHQAYPNLIYKNRQVNNLDQAKGIVREVKQF